MLKQKAQGRQKKPDIRAIEKRLIKLEYSVRQDIYRKLRDQSERLDRFEPHIVESFFDNIEERTKNLSDRLQMFIFKTAVCTEVSFVIRHKLPQKSREVHHALMWALDQDDGYWRSGESLSVAEWAVRILRDHKAFYADAPDDRSK